MTNTTTTNKTNGSSPASRGSRTRLKFTQPVITTRAQAEAALGEVARLTIERNTKQLAMERGILALREQYESPLATLNKQLDAQVELLAGWAEANPSEFGKPGSAGMRKSIEMQHGTLGWRQSTKLKTLKGWTWDRVLEFLLSYGRKSFVRIKEEVNKDAIREAAVNGDIDSDGLKAMGMRLAVEDTFFVEPRIEQPENRITQEAA